MLNATFVALLPVKIGSVELNIFRPITLISSVYKILAKILANRLKHALGKIVSDAQNAFIKDIQIMDSVSLLMNAWMVV